MPTKVEMVHEPAQITFRTDGRWLVDGRTGEVYAVTISELQRAGLSAVADIQRMCTMLEADRSEYRR